MSKTPSKKRTWGNPNYGAFDFLRDARQKAGEQVSPENDSPKDRIEMLAERVAAAISEAAVLKRWGVHKRGWDSLVRAKGEGPHGGKAQKARAKGVDLDANTRYTWPEIVNLTGVNRSTVHRWLTKEMEDQEDRKRDGKLPAYKGDTWGYVLQEHGFIGVTVDGKPVAKR